MNIDELKASSVEDLHKELHELLREQFNLRMQRTTGQLAKPHLMTNVRRNIARVKTILTETTVKHGTTANAVFTT